MSERIPYAVPDAGVKNVSVPEMPKDVSVPQMPKNVSVPQMPRNVSVAGGVPAGTALRNPAPWNPVPHEFSNLSYEHVRNVRRSKE
jgi:hypothetical protein